MTHPEGVTLGRRLAAISIDWLASYAIGFAFFAGGGFGIAHGDEDGKINADGLQAEGEALRFVGAFGLQYDVAGRGG